MIKNDASFNATGRLPTYAEIYLFDRLLPDIGAAVHTAPNLTLTYFNKVTVPIGSFDLELESAVTSGTGGVFATKPKISIWSGQLSSLGSRVSIVLDTENEAINFINEITYTAKNYNEVTIETKTITAEQSRVISIDVPNGSYYIEVIINSMTATGVKLRISSVQFGNVLKVDSEDIELITISEKNDILLSSLPFGELSVSVCDNNKTYHNFYNTYSGVAWVAFSYNGNHGKPFVFHKNENAAHSNTSELEKTEFKACDALSMLTAPYKESTGYLTYWEGHTWEGNALQWVDGTPIDYKLYEVLNTAKYEYRNKIALSYETSPDGSLTDAFLSHENYKSAIKLLASVEFSCLKIQNEKISIKLMLYNMDPALEYKPYVYISFDEQFEKPQEVLYPQVKNVLVNNFARKINPDKIELCSGLKVNIPNDAYVEVNFDKVAYIPNFDDATETCVSIYNPSNGMTYTPASVEYNQMAFDYYSYVGCISLRGGDISGDLELTVSGYPIETDNIQTSFNDSEFGEDLTINNPYFGFRDELLSYPTWLMDLYKRNKAYQLNCRGRYDVHPLDLILYQAEKGETRRGIVTQNTLTYNGALRSVITVLDYTDGFTLTPDNDLHPSDELYFIGGE
jgi:hypothetical protein